LNKIKHLADEFAKCFFLFCLRRALLPAFCQFGQAAKSAQAEGDALYWSIYNLDFKNPHAKAGLEHADPQDLIAAMRSHEAEVMRLLGEIESLMAEVQA
jgi:hypothetical protein